MLSSTTLAVNLSLLNIAPFATIDFAAERMHMLSIMTALMQPVLWVLLLVGFVMASAHLLTMLGTRWGDKRVSPKALTFSIGVHLSLAVAVVACIPEYRQRIFKIGEEEPPVQVQLDMPLDDAPTPIHQAGNTPVWEQLPRQVRHEETRSPSSPQVPLEQDGLADTRLAAVIEDHHVPETVPLPKAPESLPNASVKEIEAQRDPSAIPLRLEDPTAESRIEAELPSQEMRRSEAAIPALMAEAPGDRPVAGAVERLSTDIDPTRALSSVAGVIREDAPLRMTPDREEISRRTGPAPVPIPFDAPGIESQPAPNPGAAPSSDAPRLTRTRTRSPAMEAEAGVSRVRPTDIPTAANLRPEEREISVGGSPLASGLPEMAVPRADGGLPGRLATVDGARVPAEYQMRTQQDLKDEAVRRFGGTDDSQKAVQLALKWLSEMQEPDGSWDASKYEAGNGPFEAEVPNRRFAGQNADTGVTGLVVLALLGDGNTLREGPYSANVDSAIQWVIGQQRRDGSLAGNATEFEAMYCHGIAALALAEAYGMERDPVARQKLRAPLERALQFAAASQLTDGGWRYIARQPEGDMSMFGWQLMAFRSGETAGIPIPPEIRDRLVGFLQNRSRGRTGGLAGYREKDPPTPTMTAEALACKQLLGLRPDNPMSREAVDYLLQNRPKRSSLNLYYWYYGTFAMFQHGGDPWQQWNNSLRDLLVTDQVQEGEFAGTWDPRGPYGRYGGRLFSTSMSVLCLEVYYRRLPMFQQTNTPVAP